MEGLGVEVKIRSDRTLEYNEVKFVMNKKGKTELMQDANIKNKNDN